MFGNIGGREMVGNDFFQEIEPEKRELRKNAPLFRDSSCEHVVERRDAIGGDEKQMIGIDAVNVADFAAGMKFKFRKVGPKQDAAGS